MSSTRHDWLPQALEAPLLERVYEGNEGLVSLNSAILTMVQITAHIPLVFTDILYDEPKKMKAAPSQQTNLTELWKKKVPKKGEGKTKAPPTEVSSVKGGEMPAETTPFGSKVMDVDVRSSRSPESSRACKI